MIPAHGEIPHHTPQVINSDIPPSSSRFTGTIQTPNLLHLAAEFFTEDLPETISVIAKSSGEDNEVRIEGAAVFELQPSLGELLDDGVVLESDLSVDDHLAGSDVCEKDQRQERNFRTKHGEGELTKVVSSTAAVQSDGNPASIRTIRQLETLFRQPVQDVPAVKCSSRVIGK
jgi:hypothetical protein